jgi:alanyl-tRNA synthetase
MKTALVRKKFIEFFTKNGHKSWPASSLLPQEEDGTVLFTSAGMQQFKDWYLDKEKIESSRIVTAQKCFRTSDIEEVGDKTHHTLFEMLGNFSFGYPEIEGSYFKEETIRLAYQFLTDKKWLGIEKKQISASIFKGDKEVPKDKESEKILKKIGLKKITELGRDENFWGPVGATGCCGPTVEFFVSSPGGQSVEIWNLVFNQYYKKGDGDLEKLKFQGVDTGFGLERVVAYLQKTDDDYQTDIFRPIIEKIAEISGKKYQDNQQAFRIIVDHLRAAVFLLSENSPDREIIKPDSKDARGSVLVKMIKRPIIKLYLLGVRDRKANTLEELARIIIDIYQKSSPHQIKRPDYVIETLADEEKRFRERIFWDIEMLKKRGVGSEKDLKKRPLTGKIIFNLHQQEGIDPEFAVEIAKSHGISIKDKAMEEYQALMEKHREISGASKGRFKSGLADSKDQTVKLHTATHLLHEALRRILGKAVNQAGQNITEDRLRFDFTYPKPLTEEELKKVEDLVNRQIKKGLAVESKQTTVEKAVKEGAVALFRNRYPDRVTLYSIGTFSKELCLGPHVGNTKELGRFKITKEESSSKGIRRIRGKLIN